MVQNIKRASESLYNEFRTYFPFSTVDLLVISEEKFLLSKRLNEPYKNMWHLPGGMIRKGEKMIDTVKRISIEELGSTTKIIKFFGIEKVNNPEWVGFFIITTIFAIPSLILIYYIQEKKI